MVWPLIMGAARTYAPYITFPVALVVGFIGYNIEGWIRGKDGTPFKAEGVKEERSERVLEQIQDKDCTEVESLKVKSFVPKTILGRNDK
ncbi:small integral membrane protein 12-B-like [Babylonia areolata]|uniref:small integral membrane protein 12-B-like n=1 Tax=Babylonia areolata TaxID=304850 RepID=UPI003FD6540D